LAILKQFLELAFQGLVPGLGILHVNRSHYFMHQILRGPKRVRALPDKLSFESCELLGGGLVVERIDPG
jgi:hypothetical protein